MIIQVELIKNLISKTRTRLTATTLNLKYILTSRTEEVLDLSN